MIGLKICCSAHVGLLSQWMFVFVTSVLEYPEVGRIDFLRGLFLSKMGCCTSRPKTSDDEGEKNVLR